MTKDYAIALMFWLVTYFVTGSVIGLGTWASLAAASIVFIIYLKFNSIAVS